MTKVERVSIIIPLFNAVKYIDKTINSILSQSFRDFKLYIVDDHATDGSSEIAIKYAQQYPAKIIYHKPKERAGRPSVGKNIGIKISQGEYIAFMDHDDWWTNDHLELLVKAMKRDEFIGLVGSNGTIFDNDDQKSLGDYSSISNNDNGVNVGVKALLEPPFLTSSCMLFRRSVLDDVGMMDSKLLMSDDHEIAMRIVLTHKYKVVALPKSTIFRRWHTTSLSNSSSSIATALGDTDRIYNSFISRADLTEHERGTLNQWYQTARRRWANYLVDIGDYAKAKKIYQTLRMQGRFGAVVGVINVLLYVCPPLARLIVKSKRAWSFKHPYLQ